MRSSAHSPFAGQKVLIVGLGLHGGGAAAVRWFCRQRARVRVTDRQSAGFLAPTLKKLKALPVAWRLGQHRWADFSWADVIVQNPGVPDSLPELRRARRLGKTIVNEASIFFTLCPAKIIGVTGTRGKTTTALLLGHILRQRSPRVFVAGNVREVVMFDLLDRLRASDTVVLELSSFQLELLPSVKRSPAIAVMTNILVDHLNRYGTMPAYAAAKYPIVQYQRPADTAVLNLDSLWTKRAAKMTKAKIVWFSEKNSQAPSTIRVRRGWVVEEAHQRVRRILPLNVWSLPGRHQRINLLAAVAAARAAGLEPPLIRQAVSTFPGVPDRQEFIRQWRGHQFVNDTTATTPDATLAALDVYPQAVYIIGGTDKHLTFTALAQELTRQKTTLVLLPGTATAKLWRSLRHFGYRGRHVFVPTMIDAVHQAIAMARPRQTIMLSPGAASFGLFRHEFDRGEQFTRAVKTLR